MNKNANNEKKEFNLKIFLDSLAYEEAKANLAAEINFNSVAYNSANTGKPESNLIEPKELTKRSQKERDEIKQAKMNYKPTKEGRAVILDMFLGSKEPKFNINLKVA